eukprot:1875031-Prymnesium_polylepis.1
MPAAAPMPAQSRMTPNQMAVETDAPSAMTGERKLLNTEPRRASATNSPAGRGKRERGGAAQPAVSERRAGERAEATRGRAGRGVGLRRPKFGVPIANAISRPRNQSASAVESATVMFSPPRPKMTRPIWVGRHGRRSRRCSERAVSVHERTVSAQARECGAQDTAGDCSTHQHEGHRRDGHAKGEDGLSAGEQNGRGEQHARGADHDAQVAAEEGQHHVGERVHR